MKTFYDPVQSLHDPQFFLVRGKQQPSAEQPERASRLLNGLQRLGLRAMIPESHDTSSLAAVHTPEYLRFLASAHQRWSELRGAGAEVVPNIHPQRLCESYPAGILGQAGWHMADTACPIGASTYASARRSADCALSASQAVLDGETVAYALCRPPGHHAFSDMAGGFCFLNNAAIAARYCLRSHQRIAILDIDVHHGNGTQGIFYRRRDVLTVSLHADPNHFYPFHWGYAAERGDSEGEGYNLNLPLALLSGDDLWIDALRIACESVSVFAPDVLIVALGLDASESDPLQGLTVTIDGFARAAAVIQQLGLPTVLIQEGGYLSDDLSDNLAAFLEGFST